MASGNARPKPTRTFAQSGVIACRNKSGKLRILLITSRRSKRWVIPKGMVAKDTTADESAAKEAWEEAGARGDVSPVALGAYTYEKWGGVCHVEVFSMNVEELADTWPEDHFRTREWVDPRTAIKRVREPELRDIIAGIVTSHEAKT
ncbi:NUDIX hydrolase [Candidatus Poribacteria bacterium]|jgi:8-oxo-dGTP pyrophosphatase MutT (NUDIX family)|nr:NUDIX hydrolase [Candidatus Poribacteria bacterium]MBT5713802.1 NUDIX hydrolase [Candidatus Poribacteria bacterium]MBT7808490.1 NUDIX hydrolase [Candidatus Poribacteria bacterium]